MFGKVLHEIRTQNELTQKQVCELAEISTSYYSQLEGSKRTPPSITIILKLATALQANNNQKMQLLDSASEELGLQNDEISLSHEVQELILEIRKNATNLPARFFKALTTKIREANS